MTSEITVFPGGCWGVAEFGIEAMVVTATLLLTVMVVTVGGITSASVIVIGVVVMIMMTVGDGVIGGMGISEDRFGS